MFQELKKNPLDGWRNSENGKKTTQVSNWGKNSTATWTVNVLKPGYYYLDLNYKGENRLVWKTETDEGVIVQNQQAATEKYESYPMGILEFKTAGKHTISVSLVEGDVTTSSLKLVTIRPIVSRKNNINRKANQKKVAITDEKN
ncbi:hypothetical protein N9V96_02075 [Polaribacter sp.]|nr:hypothetical protein [Polaribacter sp.]